MNAVSLLPIGCTGTLRSGPEHWWELSRTQDRAYSGANRDRRPPPFGSFSAAVTRTMLAIDQ